MTLNDALGVLYDLGNHLWTGKLVVAVVLIVCLAYIIGWLLALAYDWAEARAAAKREKRERELQAAAGVSKPPRAPGLRRDRRDVR